MKTVWKLRDARSHFSQMVDDSLRIGPHYVSRSGVEAVAMLSVAQYKALISNKPGLTDFLLTCPAVADELVLDRQKDLPRSIDL